jgi:N-carbamoyl-L-amino-acid hydrolase
MEDRHDPMTAFARTAVAADTLARDRGMQATFARIEVVPNVTNAIPSEVRAWLDVRAGDDAAADAAVRDISELARRHADDGGVCVDLAPESVTEEARFDGALRTRVSSALRALTHTAVPAIPTAAGHDAGILAAAGIRTSMLFVRNPTGISHSPAEHAEQADCLAGVAALTAVIEDLAGGLP